MFIGAETESLLVLMPVCVILFIIVPSLNVFHGL